MLITFSKKNFPVSFKINFAFSRSFCSQSHIKKLFDQLINISGYRYFYQEIFKKEVNNQSFFMNKPNFNYLFYSTYSYSFFSAIFCDTLTRLFLFFLEAFQ